MSDDRRRSFRLPLPEGQEQAVLRVGRREVDVRLVNTSATGFAILSPEAVKGIAGQQLQLQTVAGWSEVRIAWAARFDDGEVLGVERLHDLDKPPPPIESIWGHAAVAAGVFALAMIGGALFYYWSLDEETRQASSAGQIAQTICDEADRLLARIRNP